MKNQLATLILIMITSATTIAQTDKILIEQTVNQFAQAGDQRDVAQLKNLLHDDFRIAMNRLFGSEKVDFLTKPAYIKMMEDGKLGGDSRTVKILSVDITENNAAVKVSLKGKALTFQSYYHLVKNVTGQWQLINDLPFASKN
ncbi:MAG: nuclear transport factor 2 family protein [Cyclobacteriaceae bacterium]